jgi:hypothetical protein
MSDQMGILKTKYAKESKNLHSIYALRNQLAASPYYIPSMYDQT